LIRVIFSLFSNNFLGSKRIKLLKWLLTFATLAFSGGRIYISFVRFQTRMLENDAIHKAHILAWAILFSMELLFSISILCISYKNYKGHLKTGGEGPSFFVTLFKSNLFVLFSLDVFGCCLAVTAYFNQVNSFVKSLADILNIMKSSFPLLLATDALCIKIQQRNQTDQRKALLS
jgi:hypothetical protein